MKVTQIEADRAVVELEIRPESKNLYGMIHGGVFVSMADFAAGSAARSRGGWYVTLDTNFSFLKNADQGKIRAVSKVRHRGNTICVVAVDVLDEKNTLLASGTFTMYCIDQKGEMLK